MHRVLKIVLLVVLTYLLFFSAFYLIAWVAGEDVSAFSRYGLGVDELFFNIVVMLLELGVICIIAGFLWGRKKYPLLRTSLFAFVFSFWPVYLAVLLPLYHAFEKAQRDREVYARYSTWQQKIMEELPANSFTRSKTKYDEHVGFIYNGKDGDSLQICFWGGGPRMELFIDSAKVAQPIADTCTRCSEQLKKLIAYYVIPVQSEFLEEQEYLRQSLQDNRCFIVRYPNPVHQVMYDDCDSLTYERSLSNVLVELKHDRETKKPYYHLSFSCYVKNWGPAVLER